MLTVDESSDSDLFWALRGMGPNFGAVTRLVFRTHPLGPVVVGRSDVALDRARDVLARIGRRPTSCRAPSGCSPGCSGWPAKRCSPWRGSGPTRPTRPVPHCARSGSLTTDDARGVRFTEVQAAQDHRFPHGRQYFLKPTQLAALGPEQVEALVAAAARFPGGDPQIEVLRLRGAITDVAQEATAYPRRDAAFGVNVCAAWEDPAESAAQAAWAREAHGEIARCGTGGAYLNFADAATDLRTVLGADVLDRLRRVKRRIDPDDVFRPATHITPDHHEQ